MYGPGAGHLDEPGVGGNPYPYGECTWYCWQYYHDIQNVGIDGMLGNATDWVTDAHRDQYAVDMSSAVGKTVCWSAGRYPPYGHVAICAAVNGDGSFDVLEMNFTYLARDNPQLAGKIDRRRVTSTDGILGFITPTGVTVGRQGDNSANPLDALAAPLHSIGDAIRQAALILEAQAMTAELQFTSMAQVGLGTTLAGGGMLLGVATTIGHGSPTRGIATVRNRVWRPARKVQRRLSPTKQPSPIGRRQLRTTEEQWVPKRTRDELAGERATAKLRQGVDPRKLTDAEADWLRRHPEALRDAFRESAKKQ